MLNARTLEAYTTIQELSQLNPNKGLYYTQGKHKLLLEVAAYGSWKGVHVSFYSCLIKRKNNENISFPKSGIFTVQLLNRPGKQDNNHEEKSAVLFETKSVTSASGERSDDCGLSHLSHYELEDK